MLHPATFVQFVRSGGRHHHGRGDRSVFAAADAASVLIRPASTADAPAIERLAELEERTLPAGERLIGELAGEVVAAVDVDSGTTVADPFVPTLGVVELLGLRAAQVRR